MLPKIFPPAPDHLVVRALNALLAREPWARDRLTRHAGKSVRFAAAGMKLNLAIAATGTTEVGDPAIVPDVTLTLDLERFTPLSWAAQKNAAARAGHAPAAEHDPIADITHIEGDAGLAQVVSELARHLRWDAEDDLARVVGDIAAARLVGAARDAAQGLRRAGERLAGNLAEYLSEERAAIAASPLLADLRAQNAHTSEAAQALDARLARLDARLSRITDNRP
jgi:ubiquinone biosynthesis protein UbiJ